jgi:hypothetical protein
MRVSSDLRNASERTVEIVVPEGSPIGPDPAQATGCHLHKKKKTGQRIRDRGQRDALCGFQTFDAVHARTRHRPVNRAGECSNLDRLEAVKADLDHRAFKHFVDIVHPVRPRHVDGLTNVHERQQTFLLLYAGPAKKVKYLEWIPRKWSLPKKYGSSTWAKCRTAAEKNRALPSSCWGRVQALRRKWRPDGVHGNIQDKRDFYLRLQFLSSCTIGLKTPARAMSGMSCARVAPKHRRRTKTCARAQSLRGPRASTLLREQLSDIQSMARLTLVPSARMLRPFSSASSLRKTLTRHLRIPTLQESQRL